MDDCLGATFCTKEELGQFMGYVNSFNPALKFTWEIATEGNFETPVTSLDINITTTFLSNTIIWQPVFITSLQIRTANYCTQSYTSSHPSHVKDSIPYSQFLRLRILCSDDSDLNSKRDEMSNFFPERGYPDSILSKALNRVQNVNRESAWEPSASNDEERIPFTL